MLSRKNDTNDGKKFPQTWVDQLKNVIIQTYQNEIQSLKLNIDVFGFTYPDEALLIVSFCSKDNPNNSNSSVFISADVEANTNMELTLKNLVDSCSVIIEQILKQTGWDDYLDLWQEFEFKKQTLFYKINRENVAITIQANELLDSN